MKYLGMLIICAVFTALVMLIWYVDSKGRSYSKNIIFLTFLTITGVLYGFCLAFLFGIRLIING